MSSRPSGRCWGASLVKKLPNIISLLRLALTPFLVLVAWRSGSRGGFLVLLGLSLFTDWLDGFLARILNAQSDLGRRLDSWGDYATVVAAAMGLWFLWPEEMHREFAWLIATVVSYFAIVVYGLALWGKIPGYHTWFAKAMAFVLPAGVIPLLAGWSAAPFHAAVVLQVLCGVEELAIAALLPGHSGEISGIRQALRLRHERG